MRGTTPLQLLVLRLHEDAILDVLDHAAAVSILHAQTDTRCNEQIVTAAFRIRRGAAAENERASRCHTPRLLGRLVCNYLSDTHEDEDINRIVR